MYEASMPKRLTNDEWISRARIVHGDKYDYSKVEYTNNKTKVCIICPIHGEFWQRAKDHIEGRGCDKCGGTYTITKNEFIQKSVLKHGYKYDYSKVKYNGYNSKVCIVCPKHGEFWQTPHSHSCGCGCPTCIESHLERDVRRYLADNGIKYEVFKHFEWLGKQHLDFYLPEYKIGIECQGIQHFKPVEYFGGEKRFIYQIDNDVKKKKLCEKNNIKIIYLTDVKDKPHEDVIYNINEIKEKIIKYGSNKN